MNPYSPLVTPCHEPNESITTSPCSRLARSLLHQLLKALGEVTRHLARPDATTVVKHVARRQQRLEIHGGLADDGFMANVGYVHG